MLGDSAVLGTGGGSSGGADAVVATAATPPSAAVATPASVPPPPQSVSAAPHHHHDGAAEMGGGGGGGGGGSTSGDDDKGERSFGGNRWPRQETLALLKIRSDMDVAFRDASVKGPLWEEVSRKLAELGYHRNAKKCKEKFENVYKYHKRTKDGRSGKSEGKTYRFFDQLEALENNPAATQPPIIHSPVLPQKSALQATPVSMVKTTASLPSPPIITTMPQQVVVVSGTNTNTNTTSSAPPIGIDTVPSIATTTISMPPIQPNNNNNSNNNNPAYFPPPPPPPSSSFPSIPAGLLSDSSSSSTSSEETIEGGSRRNKRKRRWKDFFERLMKEVIEKQEDLQKRFLEAIEKREKERSAREEAWRVQELQRINKEREILAQERSIAAAKDQAVMTFLHKIAQQQNLPTPPFNNVSQPPPQPPPPPPPPPVVQQQQQAQTTPAVVVPLATPPRPPPPPPPSVEMVKVVDNNNNIGENNNNNNNNSSPLAASSSRWPKAEVEALINLRTSLDAKYQENGPKGPLWEEISALMKKHGYNRNAKRCKEKWENINKYFKKVKESNKKRPEDSKTCPYFHQLDALYRERNSGKQDGGPAIVTTTPLMVRPEQQWPPQTEQHSSQPREITMEDAQKGGNDEDEEEEKDNIGDEDEDEDDDDDDEGGSNFEIVASKPVSAE